MLQLSATSANRYVNQENYRRFFVFVALYRRGGHFLLIQAAN